MPVSSYFNNEGNRLEQFLIEDHINEAIKNHGIDVYYIPRESRDSVDNLYGEDTIKKYVRHYTMEMYLLNFEGFDGDDDFFSKFGLEIRKEIKLVVTRRTFQKYMNPVLMTQPREGDLVFVRYMNALFEIKKVVEDKEFFPLGAKNPLSYELTVELFKISNELVQSGLAEVDEGITMVDSPTVQFTVSGGNSLDFEIGEQVYQGANLVSATADAYVAEWNKQNLTLKLKNIRNVFTDNTTIIGVTSNAQYTLVSGDETDDSSSSFDDNALIEQKESGVINFDESNPFGEP